MGYKLFTDICCDLPYDYVQQHGLCVMPYPMTIDGKEYSVQIDPDHPDGMHPRVFYDKLRAGAMPKTSQLSMELCKGEFESALKQGLDVIYIAFTSGLSGSYNAACLMAKELSEQYPRRKITVIDSLCASMGEGLLVYMAVERMEAGMGYDELVKFVEDTRQSIHHWVIVDDLMHLKRGGRASGPVAVLGTILGIKPVIVVAEDGKLPAIDKVQGRKRALKHLVDKMEEEVKRPITEPVFLSHGDCEADARAVADMVRERLGVEVKLTSYLLPIIGSHIGPGTVALFFVSDKPRLKV